jgi:hypothetical protein
MADDIDLTISEDSRWVEQAGRILAGLGFALVEPDPTAGADTSHLLVAIRPAPTKRHFDPETIDFWVCEEGRGKASRLDLESRYPLAAEYSWGLITLMDRLDVVNQFLSFGGALRAAIAPDATVLVDFSSRAPIVRGSGHSQTVDPLSAEVGAFFGRIKVPIDFVPGAEALVGKAAPRALYCAFIQNVRDRLLRARTLREANRWLAHWSARESRHMQASAPDDWQAATELRRRLAAIEPITRK